jgi:SAM-dependent methyltransferase
MPIGQVTRGTTGTNRLRRMDRWIATLPQLRRPDALVVDLGYGASATTVIELQQRIHVPVVGLEISPERVAIAKPYETADVRFALGGFELAALTPTIVRAANVLRQYKEEEVLPAWREMVSRLQPGGLVIDGTCNEVGRLATWVAVGDDGPVTLTVASRLRDLEAPSDLAERLPKVLIHRNVAGERIHQFFVELDRAWEVHAGLGVYSPSQRWIAVARTMKDAGWPVLGGVRRWRLGELTVAWEAVAPSGFRW